MRYAAFLRAVNVAGNSLSMAGLKQMFEQLGFEEPHAFLQSGNIIFGAGKQKPADLEAALERETQKRLGVRTEFFLRTAKDLSALIERNPFPHEAKTDPGRLVVVFLKCKVTATALETLHGRIKGREVVKALATQLYITYPDGQGRSKLTNAVIESALGTRGTARNWNTVLKAAALL